MIMKNILIGMALILVTSSCNSEEPLAQATMGGLDLIVVDDKGRVTADVIAESLMRGRRVLVIFDEFSDEDGNTWKCPVKIRTVDNACQDKDFQNSDPSVICRWAGDNASHLASQKKIRWVAENGDPFTITFPSRAEPCKADSWTGDKFDASHTCKIQDGDDLNAGAADAIFL